MLKIKIFGSLRYRIPSNFSLKIDVRKAIEIASDYLRNILKKATTFTNPFGQPALFVVVQDHLILSGDSVQFL